MSKLWKYKKLTLAERIRLSEQASAMRAQQRLLEANERAMQQNIDAAWHPSDEEYDRIIDQWTYKPAPTIPKWLAIVGAIVAIACVLWTIHLLRGGLL